MPSIFSILLFDSFWTQNCLVSSHWHNKKFSASFFLSFCFVVQIGYLSWHYFYIMKVFFFCSPISNPLCRLMEEPAAYGKLGLANLLELREECLREFQFVDVYRSIKQRLTTFFLKNLGKLCKLSFSKFFCNIVYVLHISEKLYVWG